MYKSPIGCIGSPIDQYDPWWILPQLIRVDSLLADVEIHQSRQTAAYGCYVMQWVVTKPHYDTAEICRLLMVGTKRVSHRSLV